MPERDVCDRARQALEGITDGPWMAGGVDGDYPFWVDTKPDLVCIPIADEIENRADAEFIAAAPGLVRELVAEVEQLREGGPWVEHVERMKAMQRERDGDCTCDGNPSTTNGPEEDCPYHGREYRYWVGRADEASEQAAQWEALWRQDLETAATALRERDEALANSEEACEHRDMLLSRVEQLNAEVERRRSYKSLPIGMVWQDYYSPDDVCKIRRPLDDEIERLRAEVERLRANQRVETVEGWHGIAKGSN